MTLLRSANQHTPCRRLEPERRQHRLREFTQASIGKFEDRGVPRERQRDLDRSVRSRIRRSMVRRVRNEYRRATR